MTNIPAKRRKPTGFRDPEHFEEQVTIVGFVFGEHRDAAGYNRAGKTTLAVYIDGSGRLSDAPIQQFEMSPVGEVS